MGERHAKGKHLCKNTSGSGFLVRLYNCVTLHFLSLSVSSPFSGPSVFFELIIPVHLSLSSLLTLCCFVCMSHLFPGAVFSSCLTCVAAVFSTHGRLFLSFDELPFAFTHLPLSAFCCFGL